MEAILRLANYRNSEAVKACRPNEPTDLIITTILASFE